MTWFAKGGGVDNNVFLTIKGMQDEYESHLAVGREIHQNIFQQINGLPIHICKDLVRAIHPIKDLKALLFFIRLMRKYKYDIIHTHETKASILSRIAARLTGSKCIIYGLHGVTFNDPINRMRRKFYILIEKATIWMNHYIVSVSQDAIDHYHNKNIGKKIPYQVVYSGIDIKKFLAALITNESEKQALRSQLNIQPDDIVITNIGRFSYAKAQRYTIQSFAKLTDTIPHIKLLLIGEGELMEKCRKMVRELGIEQQVIFYGYAQNISKLLSISDILVLTSLREGLPRVVVEAALAKVPAVAFQVEGIGEIITNTQNGYIVPKYDVDLLTQKIQTLIENEDLRLQFGKRIYQHVLKRWEANVMVDKLKKIYHHLTLNIDK